MVVKVEEFALSGGGAIHEKHLEIVESYVMVEKADRDWNLEGIATIEKVQASSLKSKRREM